MITIVSLAFNKLEMTRSFLDKLRRYTEIPHKLVFTDNGSTEPIGELVKEYYPDSKLIIKDKNVGCPATRNEAMSFVDTEFTFWLDNDAMVGPEWYEPLLEVLKDPTVGITGPQGYRVGNPFTLPYPFYRVNAEYESVDYFMGWMMGFRTELYKPINDYKLPVNLDDVELCFGIKEKGYTALTCPWPFAKHLTSQTDRGWQADDKLTEMWNNWPDKSIFEDYK